MSKHIPNKYRAYGKKAYLTITRLDGTEVKILFDREDLDRVQANGPWSICSGRSAINYARHTLKIQGKLYYDLLHRYIAKTPEDLKCDILSGADSWDYRKKNLVNTTQWGVTQTRAKHRLPPQYQSGEKGIVWLKSISRWKIFLNRVGRKHRIKIPGSYATVAEAIVARDKWLADNPNQ